MEREKLIATVTAAQNGDSEALNTLFNAFYNDVYYFALKTVKDDDLACDITQETFVEIINTIGDLHEPAAFVKWMKQITYHQCTRYFKKKKDVLVDEDEEGNTIFDTLKEEKTEFIPDEALDQQDFRDTILAMLDELSEEQRSATMLYYYDEMSVKQIAEIQNVSEGTVKSRLNYARKSIKNSVETYEKKNGVKLHCAGVLPLLLWLLSQTGKETMPAAAVKTVAGGVTAATGITVSAAASAGGAAVATATATTVATTTGAGLAAKIVALPVVTKVVAGVVAGSLVLGGVGVAVIPAIKPEPTMQSTTAPSGTTPTQTQTGVTQLPTDATQSTTEETHPPETTTPTTETTVPTTEATEATTPPTTTTPPVTTPSETTIPTETEQTQPTTARYYVAEGYTYTKADGTVLSAGDPMPGIPDYGDTYANDVYTYRYGYKQYASYDNFENVTDVSWIASDFSGWSVGVTDVTRTTYPTPEESICGITLVSMDYTFYGCSEMTEAPPIPETVTSMNGTFHSCAALTEAPDIPAGVVTLNDAFRGCTALTEAPQIPAGITGLNHSFNGCSSLTSAPDIPAGVISMNGTFKNCALMTEVPVLPEGIIDMGHAFYGCTSLASAPVIPESVETLSNTFHGCTNLTEVPNLPSSLTNMPCTFADCTALTSVPAIPSGVTNMWGTFMACTALESAPKLPETVTDLSHTFMSCLKITQAPVIPASVTEMRMTFYGCHALTDTIEVNANPTTYDECFAYTQQPITLTGSSTMLVELAATSNNGNVTVQLSE